jgi:hypothetical protein
MNDEITPAQAAALLERNRQQRAAAARVQIEAILSEHRCQLVAVPQIADGRIVAVIQLLPE